MKRLVTAFFTFALAVGIPSWAFAETSEKVPPGMGKYLIVLWDAGTPIPGASSHKVMKRVEEPDYGKGGGRLIEKFDNQRVVYLPRGIAKQLRRHQAVAYIQPVYVGEPLEDWYDDEDIVSEGEGVRLRVRTDTDTNLTWDRAFSYDGSGNITAVGTDQYTYDTAGRLIRSVVNGKEERFKYDGFGNLIEKALAGTPTVKIDVDPGSNKINGGAGYDQAGNQTVSGQRVYTYDALNMLSYVGTRRMIYDASDERIGVIKDQSLVRWTLRDFDGRPLREFKSEGMTNVWKWELDYFYAEGQLVAGDSQKWGYFDGTANEIFGGRRYYHLDHLGSVRMVSDNSGRSVSENDYYAFGATATKTFQEPINPGDPHVDTMRFAGHTRDFLGNLGTETDDSIDYMHARQYDPRMGRFLSVDPAMDLEKIVHDPQLWNRYSYVGNNPIRFTDPDGRERLQHYHFGITPRQVSAAEGALSGARMGLMAGAMLFGGAALEGGAMALASRFPMAYLRLMEVGVGATTGIVASRSVSLDTNAVIAAVEGGAAGAASVSAAMGGRTPLISPTVVAEYAKRGNMGALVDFIKSTGAVVAKNASAELVKQMEARGLKPADAQAVAAAVANGTKFLTRDKEILKKVPDIAEKF